ncbi:YbjN domain-containing protein [Rhodopseudomonas palustris]|uniref:YbjN domain-containing protein n=1 Tax=Rhodopseudomonas palustris TaxID=1076 RepID=UPI0020CFD6FC|nr:YbjN domain-containing protein [Rhodopseudomonas palustris]MCP9629785.1 YbjN domain-containing protein [Rhodopseudomonas palustris]
MAMLEGIFDSRNNNPLAAVEDIAASNDLVFERSGEDEITIAAKGQWTDYTLSFTWMGEIEALHLACAFDMKVPTARRGETQRLIAAINEQLWVGHFDIWTHTGTIMYRQALILPGGLSATSAQCETMLISSITACERYYPAIQFTVWAGKTASEAMSAAMFDTEGEA